MSQGGATAKFLSGDLMRHVVVMSLSASIGLLSIFIVDFVDLYFISLLGDQALTAAVGFAGTLIFFNMSAGIGLMIAMSALAARSIGEGDPGAARKIATNIMLIALGVGVLLGGLFIVFAPQLMELIGAEGAAKTRGANYLRIVAFTAPVMMLGMASSGLLRAHGDAKRAMNATLAAGIVNAVLDPIFIFYFGLEIEGAAIASGCARVAMTITAVWPVIRIYGGFAPFQQSRFMADLPRIFGIAGPAILTNAATPIGMMILMRFIASFGDAAVAGNSVISRLTPLAFCVIFALSGAVGPIIGQNFGARNFPRVRETVKNALVFAAGYILLVWGILVLSAGWISAAFGLDPLGRQIVWTFALYATPLYFFSGALFISNAAFNNLDRPTWSTVLNWGKNTIGVLPFVWLGAHYGGAPGIVIAFGVGGAPFALLGVWLVFKLIRSYETGAIEAPKTMRPAFASAPKKEADA